jgi:cystathionine gamma-synthase
MDFRGFPVQADTKVVRGFQGWEESTGSISFPIFQSATFRHPSLGETTGWDYSRQGNPTRRELEKTIAALEGADYGFAFSSGMAAISAVLDLLNTGDHVVWSEDLYGGTFRLAQELGTRHGLTSSFVDTQDLKAVENAFQPNTRLLFVESPSNPLMRICNLAQMAQLCRRTGILFVVDNTFLTPLLQQPLALGADLVVHSGTKFLAGHNDVLAGFVVTAQLMLAEKLNLIAKTSGANLSPFDSWLVLRGLKTLALRLERQQANAAQLADFLVSHPKVSKVFFPGLENHEGYATHQAQARGPGAMLSFRVKDPQLIPQILEKVQLILFAESLGGVETLITFPRVQTHAALPEELCQRLGVDETLLRLSVGIENIADLKADLKQAFEND